MKKYSDKRLVDCRHSLLKAIQHCDNSQEILGDLSGLGRPKINYLLNRGKKIIYEDAVRIAEATGDAISPFQLIDHLPADLKKALMAQSQRTEPFTLSERVMLAQLYEIELKRQPDPQIKGRIETFVAQSIPLGNYQTYRQAKQAIRAGIPALRAAMDAEKISIFMAWKIAHYTPEQQQSLLQLTTPQKMCAWMEEHPSELSPSSSTTDQADKNKKTAYRTKEPLAADAEVSMRQDVLRRLLTDRNLAEMERRDHWPLRLLYFCLTHLTDSNGRLASNWQVVCHLLIPDQHELAAACQALVTLGWLQASLLEET
jgi:hypothetical protein